MNTTMTLEELRYLVKEAKGPADLVDLMPRMRLSFGFADALAELWVKTYDDEKDTEQRRKIIAEGMRVANEVIGSVEKAQK